MVLFDPHIRLLQVSLPRIKRYQRVMAEKRYSTFPKVPKLETHSQIQFSVIIRKPFCVGGSYLSAVDTVSEFSFPTDMALGNYKKKGQLIKLEKTLNKTSIQHTMND